MRSVLTFCLFQQTEVELNYSFVKSKIIILIIQFIWATVTLIWTVSASSPKVCNTDYFQRLRCHYGFGLICFVNVHLSRGNVSQVPVSPCMLKAESACVLPEKPSVSVSDLTLWLTENLILLNVWLWLFRTRVYTHIRSYCLTPFLLLHITPYQCTFIHFQRSNHTSTLSSLHFNFTTLPLAFSFCNQCYLWW